MPVTRQVAEDGFALVPEVLTTEDCERIASMITGGRSASGGTRGLLAQGWCRSLAGRLRGHRSLAPLFEPELVAVQCTYFEKSVARNWAVPVHQDLSIPVAARVEDPRLGGWSEKEGTLFVQPPVELLQQLLAVRVHLDRCTAEDGPLRVVPGSHAVGRVGGEAAVAVRDAKPEFVCTAPRGSVLVMRPLLLHSSSKAAGAGRRRVLHFLFGPADLPLGLRWSDAD